MKKYHVLGALSLISFGITVFRFSGVVPFIHQIPDDFYYEATVHSHDNFYNEEEGEYEETIDSNTVFSFKAVATNADTATIQNTFDVKTPEGEPIFAVERLYAVDRKTWMHKPGYGDADREGYLFAPKSLQPGDEFSYWHVNYDAPAQMKFVRAEELYGETVYKYETYYEGQTIDQTENLGHLPGVPEQRGVQNFVHLQVWVEPISGWLVKYADNTVARYYDQETKDFLVPWNNFSNEYTEESVKEQVANAKRERLKHTMSRFVAPSAFATLGVLFSLLALIYIKKEKQYE